MIRNAELMRGTANLRVEKAILEQSPFSKSSLTYGWVPPAPDDKNKDPDWLNPWAKAPFAVKDRSYTTLLKKVRVHSTLI